MKSLVSLSDDFQKESSEVGYKRPHLVRDQLREDRIKHRIRRVTKTLGEYEEEKKERHGDAVCFLYFATFRNFLFHFLRFPSHFHRSSAQNSRLLI